MSRHGSAVGDPPEGTGRLPRRVVPLSDNPGGEESQRNYHVERRSMLHEMRVKDRTNRWGRVSRMRMGVVVVRGIWEEI